MHLSKIKLTNYRNFLQAQFAFNHSTIIVADNTRGKTNLLEAIFFLSTGKSFRTENEMEVIHDHAQHAAIEGIIQNQEGSDKLRIFFSNTINSRKKQLQVNQINRMLSNFAGHLRAVVFTPENFDLLQGSPEVRRRYLDTILMQIDRDYGRAISQYKKVVYQRNRLLQRIKEGRSKKDELEYWNERLLLLGRLIQEKRYQLISFLSDVVRRYTFLYRSQKSISLVYKINLIDQSRLLSHEKAEVETGMTLIGPHRDDFLVFLQDKRIDIFGSRGEQRLGILSLALSALDFIEYHVKERPLLLLDDIFSELDRFHRSSILNIFDKQQTIITTVQWEFKDIKRHDFKIIRL